MKLKRTGAPAVFLSATLPFASLRIYRIDRRWPRFAPGPSPAVFSVILTPPGVVNDFWDGKGHGGGSARYMAGLRGDGFRPLTSDFFSLATSFAFGSLVGVVAAAAGTAFPS